MTMRVWMGADCMPGMMLAKFTMISPGVCMINAKLAYWVGRPTGNSILIGGVPAGGCCGFDMGYTPAAITRRRAGRPNIDRVLTTPRTENEAAYVRHADGSIDQLNLARAMLAARQ